MIHTTTFILLLCLLSPATSSAQVIQKISATEGGFTGALADNVGFGSSVAGLGDLDGDGIPDLAVGTPEDVNGGVQQGTVWILFLNPDGMVKHQQKISATEGDFTGALADNVRFGSSVAGLGDFDGDEVPDLAVGSSRDDGGGIDQGAVWVLFLRRNGTVKGHHKISDAEIRLIDNERFGTSITSLGDLDDDGVTDLAVTGSNPDQNFASSNILGSIRVLFLNENGTVKNVEVIRFPQQNRDNLGNAIACVDLESDDICELAVGANLREPVLEGVDRGDVSIFFLNIDGTINRETRISDFTTAGLFLGDRDYFGSSVANLGDLNNDGVPDLVVGAPGDDDGGSDRGALWTLLMNREGRVEIAQKTSNTTDNFAGMLDDSDRFGSSLANLGDLDGDGGSDLAIGSPGDDDGGRDRGAVWILRASSLLPPRIGSPEVLPARPVLDQDLLVSAQISDLSGTRLTSALSFRRAGDPFFLTVAMQAQGAERYSFAIPASLLTTGSVEYFIKVTNGLGVESRLPTDGFFSQPIYLPDGLETPLTHGNETTAYRLLSIPLDLDEKNAGVVLEDDLGPYNKTKWRFFIQDDAQFTEPELRSVRMTPGRAFWLLVKDPGRRLTTGPGSSVATDEPFRIPLARGWNFIGSPFPYPLSVSQLRITGQALDVRRYDGAWHAVDSVLVPFEGYAVMNANTGAFADTLLIDPDVSAGTLAQQAASKGAEGLAWSIRIVAQQGQARDIDNIAAVASSASAGWDGLDRPEPPLVGDYVSVSFPHPEWQRNTAHYSTDARPVPVEGARWSFEVRTRRPGVVTLRFEGLEAVPSDYEVWVVDEALQTRQDLRLQPGYTVAGAGEGVAKQLTLVVGRRSYVEGELAATEEVPLRPVLFANYPNPFREVTTIRYGVPEAGEVSLVVYDVLGKRVATLVQGVGLAAGYHAVVWDGRNEAGVPVGSGLYVVRMQAGDAIQTRKMLFVR